MRISLGHNEKRYAVGATSQFGIVSAVCHTVGFAHARTCFFVPDCGWTPLEIVSNRPLGIRRGRGCPGGRRRRGRARRGRGLRRLRLVGAPVAEAAGGECSKRRSPTLDGGVKSRA